MAQLLTFRLARNDSAQSWGFRLQGGKDFGTPLLIQKVNAGSLAEKAGLRIGDAVVRVNNVEVAEQRHKDAQDTIIRAGNSFDVTVQRGGLVTWKPSVSPVGSIPSPNPYECVSPVPVTKTSLAATYKPGCRPPHGFNAASKPFSPQLNGGISHDGGENGAIKAIVNKQYNSPVGIYSDESIAETLSAQAEVLAGGVLGVNFKKNEKNYNAEGSEVFKMLREAENEPKSLEIDEPRPDSNSSTTSAVAGLRHVSAPRPKSPSSSEGSSLAPGKNICADCERLIVGVFVRIKGKNLHVECFKCATCGTSLKNVGYYTINEKLYCDIHAKLVARQNPPAPNLEPATVSPVTSPQHRVSDGATWKTSPSPCRLNASPTVPVNRFSTSPSPHLTLTTNGDTINTNNTHIHSGHLTNSTTTSNNVLSSKTGIFRGQSQSLKKGTSGTGGGTIGAFQSNTASASSAGLSVPRRGKGVWNPQNVTPGARIPLCAGCNSQIRLL